MDRILEGAGDDVARRSAFHSNETAPKGPNEGADSTSGAAEPEVIPGPDDIQAGCTCQSYTVTLPAEDTDPRTGEVTEPSFDRRSTSVYCPKHGRNEAFRNSFAAHAAWVCRRSSYRRCDVYHATIRLHAADVRRLGVSAEETRPILSQLLPRLRKRIRRRDEDAEVLLSMSPRPSDGQWHLHVLVMSKGSTDADVVGAFDLAGADVEVTTPHSRQERRGEAPMSAENFAACIGAYLFDNRVQGAVQGAETSFSSWGDGVGYFSKAARKRRREYAEMMGEAGGDTAPARCTSTQFRTQEERDSDDEGTTGTDTTAESTDDDVVEPVTVGVDVVQSEAVYRRVVMDALLSRLHTDVGVVGLGRCRLTWVEVGDNHGITCYVRPLELSDDEERAVPWRIVDAAETPVIRRSTAPDQPSEMDSEAETDDVDVETPDDSGDEGSDIGSEYWGNARHGRVSFVKADGSRHVRSTDHRDGKTTTTTKAPRQNQ